MASALVLLLLATASAQSAADDPFAAGAFEAQAAPAAAAAAPAKTEYLFGGAALVSAAGYTTTRLDGYAATASASGKVFAKVTAPDFGSLFISYDLSQAILEGRAGSYPSYAARAADLSSPTYALSELYYGFDVGKTLFVRLGKQLIAWGPSRVWSPVDFVNLQREDSFSPIDLRQGKPALRLHAPLGKANAFAVADFSGMVADGIVQDPATAVSYAARLDFTVGGFEFGFTGFAGKAAQAKAGFDLSGDFLGTAVYGELAAAPSYSSYDAFLQASLGFSRSLGDLKRWTISAEGFYNSKGSDLGGNAVAIAAATPLYMGRYYAFASLRAQELFSPSLTTSLSALANLSDLSYSIKLEEGFAFPRAVPFSLSLSYAGGGEGKEFTAMGGDGALGLSIEARVEF